MEPTPVQGPSSRHPGAIKGKKYVQRLIDAQDFAQAAMASAQQRNEENGNLLRRQPERFKIGDKVWLNLQNINTPQLVELNVPGNIHNKFHVELLKRAGTDPFPSQVRDDAQNPPIIDELGEEEYPIESILRARTVRRGRGKFRQALVKWVSEADPSWEPVESLEDTKALDDFEALYGPILFNDGPTEENIGKFVGPAEPITMEKRRLRRTKGLLPQEKGGAM